MDPQSMNAFLAENQRRCGADSGLSIPISFDLFDKKIDEAGALSKAEVDTLIAQADGTYPNSVYHSISLILVASVTAVTGTQTSH
jgi:hypothetical protein